MTPDSSPRKTQGQVATTFLLWSGPVVTCSSRNPGRLGKLHSSQSPLHSVLRNAEKAIVHVL